MVTSKSYPSEGYRLSYVSYNNFLMARALDVPCFDPMKAGVSYVSSCTTCNTQGARVPHVSYVNLLVATVSHALCINLMWASHTFPILTF